MNQVERYEETKETDEERCSDDEDVSVLFKRGVFMSINIYFKKTTYLRTRNQQPFVLPND